MRRVLVTGAAGRIGRAVLDLLAATGVPATALVLDDPGDLPADPVVRGDATDPAVVRAALKGADAVVHLAAIPTPEREPAEKVFAVNTQSTFTVLEQAGLAGVRRACVAGSQAASGLPFAARDLHPAYAPIDHDLPSQAEDPYALSKLADDLTARMMARRHGMSVVSLRLPYVGGVDERLRDFATACAADPGLHARGLWAYLETGDAARACLLALKVPGPGALPVLVAAPTTLVPHPTEDLMRHYHPSTDLRTPLPGRTVPIDLTRATDLLGFTARFVL
ncbi:NAD-dependent epimerase/dehydratase family protein [Spongiactinospora sp. 9N601]|uniref:NAD-dependent epimerase/dehydratase family protein n=1 Tax=Spongiactinospora sp. 9N601 TaxID=3375149 RepID=UPI0037A96C14